MVLLAGGLFLMFTRGGGGEPVAVPQPGAVSAPAPAPSPSPTATTGGDNQELVFSGRDPFQPLVDPNAGTSGSSGSTVSPAGSPPPAPSGGSSITIDGHTVVLLDLFNQNGNDMAQVEVDGTVYTAQVGETFAQNFTLQSVNGSCADFGYGDQTFTLCESTGK